MTLQECPNGYCALFNVMSRRKFQRQFVTLPLDNVIQIVMQLLQCCVELPFVSSTIRLCSVVTERAPVPAPALFTAVVLAPASAAPHQA